MSIYIRPELMEVLSGVGGDDVSLSTFFFPKNLHISIIAKYYKPCNGTKQ